MSQSNPVCVCHSFSSKEQVSLNFMAGSHSLSAMILKGSQENPGGQVTTPFNEEKRLAVSYAAYC